jgi:trk system potassium uptake protein TrkH
MRQRRHLQARYRAILACVGLVLAVAGSAMLFPLLVLPWARDELRHAPAFAVPGVLAATLGWWTWRHLRAHLGTPTIQEGGVIVTLSWCLVSLVSAVPLVWVEGLDVTRAVFEATSGWTTTGLSVIDVGGARRLTLLWRSTMQLVGGAGLAIVMLATVARFSGAAFSGAALGAAEGRGNQLVPSVSDSARLVLRIYTAYAVLGVLAYRWAGMEWFDAVNHSFSAVSTGGFSTRAASIGAFDSVAIELVSLVLMFLGNPELRHGLAVAARPTPGDVARRRTAPHGGGVAHRRHLAPGLRHPSAGHGVTKAVRVAVFEAVSALTTTGYSTVGYTDWSPSGVLVLSLLMLIGGGTCSTAGGVKQFRVVILAAAVVAALRRARLPQRAVTSTTVRFGTKEVMVTDSAVAAVTALVALYVATLAAGTLVLTCHGYSVRDAAFEFASTLGTVGLSLGVTSPSTPLPVLWTQSAAMLFGRLELLVVLLALDKVMRDAVVLIRARADAPSGVAAR